MEILADDSRVKRVVRTGDAGSVERIQYTALPELSVDGNVGYHMEDIQIASSSKLKVSDLNAAVPRWREHTNYLPGHRRYAANYNAAVLSIPGGYVYSYEDDVIISDEKNVYNVGGCGSV